METSGVTRGGVKLGAIDLNLLVVFDAVMREGSVTRAGRLLGLSQPAMSHALARLRHMMKDDLFIRSPRGMVPTPWAEQLALPVREAIETLQRSFEPSRFDPATDGRHFRIAADNYASFVLAGPLAACMAKQAPKIVPEISPSGTLDVADLLDRGRLDLAIGSFADRPERFLYHPLMQDEFAAVLRQDHPAAHSAEGEAEMSLETFAGLAHLAISSIHHPTDFIDRALARRRLARRTALSVPFVAAPQILAESDMVSLLPRRLAESLSRYRPLAVRSLQHRSPVIETAMIWPRWRDNQPAHRWLRETVEHVAGEFDPGLKRSRPRTKPGTPVSPAA